MMGLLPHHAEMLKASGISDAAIAARGYWSATTREEMKNLGFAPNQCNAPALIIPVWDVYGNQAFVHARPDNPRADPRRPGRTIKYEFPRGISMSLDAPPLIRQLLRDPAVELIITEGVKKADSVVSLGGVCVSLLGTWNWRGTNEFGGKTVLPDWDGIALNGRKVTLAFDSDVMQKPSVHQALTRLAAFLKKKGAKVRFLYLPSTGASKLGIDDYFALGHTLADLEAFCSSELRKFPDSGFEPDENERDEMPYEATPDGLYHLRRGSGGRVDHVRLTNFSARITREIVTKDGLDTIRNYEIEATLQGRISTFTIPANDFPGMVWVGRHLGAQAVMFPGFSTKENAKTAIQMLSESTEPETVVFSHTGWRERDGTDEGSIPVYLHAGGGIGPDGVVNGIRIQLPQGLERYELPEPPTGDAEVQAIQASLSLLELGPDSIMAPLLGQLYRAVIGGTDFMVFLVGSTGAFKSEIAALMAQHLGRHWNARALPSWSSTVNALEILAFHTKDSLLIVDEFVPGSGPDQVRDQTKATRLIRSQGNGQGRTRLRSDGSLGHTRAPRGSILGTGEEFVTGQSARARVWFCEVTPGDIDISLLSQAQKHGSNGVFAAAMSGYIRFLAQHYEEIHAELETEIETLRVQAFSGGLHLRTPDIVANLAVGWKHFLRYACQIGAISAETQSTLFERVWKELTTTAQRQSQHQADQEPTKRFLALLSSALAAGKAHVANAQGETPENPLAWGWKRVSSDDDRWQPGGTLIGWVEGSDLFLEPNAAIAIARQVGTQSGQTMDLGLKSLNKRLHEKGLLLGSEIESRGTYTVRKFLSGLSRRQVLHLNARSLSGDPAPTVTLPSTLSPPTLFSSPVAPSTQALCELLASTEPVEPITAPIAASRAPGDDIANGLNANEHWVGDNGAPESGLPEWMSMTDFCGFASDDTVGGCRESIGHANGAVSPVVPRI